MERRTDTTTNRGSDAGPPISAADLALGNGPAAAGLSGVAQTAMEDVASRAGTLINELRDQAAKLDKADLAIEQKKNELTKARKDREAIVQEMQKLIRTPTLPLVPDKPRMPKDLAQQPVMFNPATGKPTENAKAEAKAKADKPAAAAGPVLTDEGAKLEPAQAGQADAWRGLLAGLDAAKLTEDGGAWPVIKLDEKEWIVTGLVPGRLGGPGTVYHLLPVLRGKAWKSEIATLPADPVRDGPLFGMTKTDQADKPYRIGRETDARYYADPLALEQHHGSKPRPHKLGPTQVARGLAADNVHPAAEVGLTRQELQAAADSFQRLKEWKKSGTPQLASVVSGVNRYLVIGEAPAGGPNADAHDYYLLLLHDADTYAAGPVRNAQDVIKEMDAAGPGQEMNDWAGHLRGMLVRSGRQDYVCHTGDVVTVRTTTPADLEQQAAQGDHPKRRRTA